MIKEELIDPRIEAMKTGKIIRDKEPISVRRKDFFFVKYTYKLFEKKFTSNLKHEIDGLIFQPVNMVTYFFFTNIQNKLPLFLYPFVLKRKFLLYSFFLIMVGLKCF